MSPETLDTTMAASSQPGAETLSSPAGLQANATLARRRAAFLTLTAVTWAGLVAWMALILSAGGWSLLDAVILVCFVFGTPWAVLGFWTAVFGYVLLHGGRDALAKVAPFLNASGVAAPLITFIILRHSWQMAFYVSAGIGVTCAVRADHPDIRNSLSMEQFLDAKHAMYWTSGCSVQPPAMAML